MIARWTSHLRRLFDTLVIVAIAVGLLGLAWRVAGERGLDKAAPPSPLITSPTLPDSPELPLHFPLEKLGMQLTRESVAGDAQHAIADLERKCEEVLASADEWVLSLAISLEEQQLLDSLAGTEPLTGPFTQLSSTVQLFPLTQPTGRAGVRSGSGAPVGRRLICWGFIAAEGTERQTVWFARPREKLPRTISPEGHAP